MQTSGSRCCNVFGSSCGSASYPDSSEEQRRRYQTSTDNATAPIPKKPRANDTLRTRVTSDMAHISPAYRLFSKHRDAFPSSPDGLSLTITQNKAIILWQCCNVIVILTSGHLRFLCTFLTSIFYLLCLLFSALCHFLFLYVDLGRNTVCPHCKGFKTLLNKTNETLFK